MGTYDEDRVEQFFAALRAKFPHRRGISAILVTHLIADRPLFIDAVAAQVDLCSVVPKPKTAHPTTRQYLSQIFKVDDKSRDELSEPAIALALAEKRGAGRPLIILDIGGYFAPAINHLTQHYTGGVLGVIEDTENGLQKYESVHRLATPVISVARSPLKAMEDFLVGQSIVFSVEALLRQQGDILHGRTACVIGYGRLGSSIANLLHDRHVKTVVFDIDPIRRVLAMAHGFEAPPSLLQALKRAGLIFCATGHVSLRDETFDQLQSGAYVATVTSSDDELDIDLLRDRYEIRHVSDYVTKYSHRGHHFFLLNRGQAVNFIHGAAVGPFIYVVQGEIVASLSRLAAGGLASGIHENSHEFRRDIATSWYNIFGPEAARSVVI